MTLLNTHLKGKLMKRFTALGPYLRAGQCHNNQFFFDCLAVCVNVKLAPEEREFWGWWMELEFDNNLCTYIYQLGVFDKEGCWKVQKITQPEVQEKLETTLRNFHKRLHDSLITMKLNLEPARHFSELPVQLLCNL